MNPVLLIHGIDDTNSIFKSMTRYLTEHQWDVHSIDLTPKNASGGLERLAQQVATYIDRTFDRQQSLDIVGFSMGGIVSRYYLQRLGGIERVDRFVSISTPHYGSYVAYGRWNEGCEQMRPGSSFLEDLNREIEILDRLQFTSIWTPYDLMIIPAHSSRVPIGKEVVIPVLLHPWMVRDPRCLTAVKTALQG